MAQKRKTSSNGTYSPGHGSYNGFVERPSAYAAFTQTRHQFPPPRDKNGGIIPKADPGKADKKSMGNRSVTNFAIDWETLRSLQQPPYLNKRPITDDDRRALNVLLGISAAVTIAYNGFYRLKGRPILKGQTPDCGGTWEEAESFCKRYGFTLATIRNQSRKKIAHAVNVKFTIAPQHVSQAELIEAGVIPKPH